MYLSERPFYNDMKWALKSKKRTIGSWLQSGSSITAEAVARSGLDWVLIDMEHGPGDIMALITQIQALGRYSTTPFVRAPGNDAIAVKKILDAGAAGVLIPCVSTEREASEAVRNCKYPPEGVRGMAGSTRAAGFNVDASSYLNSVNEQIVTMVAIETPEGFENLDAILRTEDLDGIFIGPMDFATSLGYFANPRAKEVQDKIKVIEEKVKKSDKFLGTIAGSFEEARGLFDRGYHFIAAMSDTTTLAKHARALADAFRTTFPDR